LRYGEAHATFSAGSGKEAGAGAQGAFYQNSYSGSSLYGVAIEGDTGSNLCTDYEDFYKSMTTHADHRIWQDVYRPETEAGAVYLKPTVVEDLLVVSFKEL